MGDSVAAQRESDRHSVLARGAVGGHPVAVLGAIEGVVERFGVFVPTEAAGVDALATFGPGLLAQVFGTAVAAFVVLVGVVDATGLDGAAGGGESRCTNGGGRCACRGRRSSRSAAARKPSRRCR